MAATPNVEEGRNALLNELKTKLFQLDDEILPMTQRALDETEEQRYADLVAEREIVFAEYAPLAERAAKAEEIKNSTYRELRGIPHGPSLDEIREQDIARMEFRTARDGALRVLADREASAHLSAPQIDALEKQVRQDTDAARRLLVTETDAYRSAFHKMVTDPNGAVMLSNEERTALRQYNQYHAAFEAPFERSQVVGTTTAGGFAIPVLIDPSFILTNQETDNPFLANARIVDVNSNSIKFVNGSGVSWSFDAENAEVSDDTLTLAQPTVSVFTARGFIPFSLEIGDDWPGFAGEMQRLLSAGYDELLLQKFTVGNGTSEPEGIVTKLQSTAALVLAQITKATTGGSFGAVDVYKVWKGLLQKYRRRAMFLSSVDINNRARQFGNGNALADYTVNLTAPWSGTFFGRAWWEDPYLDDFNSNTNSSANLLIVGDFSNYVIARRAGMSIELVPHILGSNGRPIGQRGWFAHARIGGGVVNTSAFRLLCNNTGA